MKTKIYDFLHEDVVRIRTEVFVIEQQFKEEFDDIDHQCQHFVFYEKNEPIAVCRIYPYDEKTYAIGRIAVQAAYRGRGLGSMVVQEAEKYIKSFGYTQVTLSAQVRAKAFYEKLGYIGEGETYFEEYCEHIRMWKNINKELTQ